MSSPFDFFQEIHCINLDHRTDRWEHACAEFSKLGILDRVSRFSAIKEEDGRIGVIKSHLAIIKAAREKKLENVLILEDDVQFIGEDPSGILAKALTQIDDIDYFLFYLGANIHNNLHKVRDNLLKAQVAYGAHAVCYSKRVYDLFVDFFGGMCRIDRREDILDVYLSENFQAKYVCLLLNPMIATQFNSYSDIEKKFVDQGYIEERFKIHIK